MNIQVLIILNIIGCYSCDSTELNSENIYTASTNEYSSDTTRNKGDIQEVYNTSISLKRNGESLIQPFQKLKSLDSSFVFYKAHFPYPEVFQKYRDTSRYQIYVLYYEELKSLYRKTNGEIGADIYLSVDKKSKKIVGIEARWAFYVSPDEEISISNASFVKDNFFPNLPTEIKADTNWMYNNESETYTENIKFIDFQETPLGNLTLPVISYVVEF